MSDEIDLSGEQDPEERMAELQERSIPDEQEDHKSATHEGEMSTDDFDVAEALEDV